MSASEYTLPSGQVVREGDWIAVGVRVHERGDNPFAEEVVVMARSHNEDMVLPVLATHVIGKVAAPDDWPRCGAMRLAGPDNTYVRCVRDNGHSGDHEDHETTWTSETVIGFFEAN